MKRRMLRALRLGNLLRRLEPVVDPDWRRERRRAFGRELWSLLHALGQSERRSAASRGIRAAILTPAFLSDSRLSELLSFPEEEEQLASREKVPPVALQMARYVIGGLGRLPGPWLPTCLYRSIAECLVLRSYGIPARVRMGVCREGEEASIDGAYQGDLCRKDLGPLGVAAHSWVEVEGAPSPVEAEGYSPLEIIRPRPNSAPQAARPSRTKPSCQAKGSQPLSRPYSECEALVWSLPADGTVVVRSVSQLRPLVEPWVPLTASLLEFPSKQTSSAINRAASILSVERASFSWDPPEGPATLEMESVRAWVEGDRALLLGGKTWGEVDLSLGRARLFVVHGAYADAAGDEVFWLLSLASALLLGRRGRCLVHAGAIADERGGAWLVAADGGSGKSTICANFVRAGWGCLSDDHVVLVGDEETLSVQGWLRPFGLDEGWPLGNPTGRKVRVDPEALGETSAFPSSGGLRGVLVPERWRAEGPSGKEDIPDAVSGKPSLKTRPDHTKVAPMRPAETLPVLIRQAGWLVADRHTAANTMRLLERVASLPAYRLSLGRDAFSDCSLVRAALGSAIGSLDMG